MEAFVGLSKFWVSKLNLEREISRIHTIILCEREGGVSYFVLKFEYGRHPGYNAKPRSVFCKGLWTNGVVVSKSAR